eukprot:Plantae.Rhodophyta-Hildenbrandia_rubra.ctg18562.p1 GENE.Plantae.Rhodophyta-Hildenbrandia_rubra.ctg18562~~Plantae.Rhodophyta-Hildenbrandia_rubra.ctg18562.p1  ORF type:complete len:712 (-),score=79.93 Plantae.Rhodophyta-Hildenbrandia_rubra.ctg18562:41-2176(-)
MLWRLLETGRQSQGTIILRKIDRTRLAWLRALHSQTALPPTPEGPSSGHGNVSSPPNPLYPGRPGHFGVPNLHDASSWVRITANTIDVVTNLKRRILSHPLSTDDFITTPSQELKRQGSELLSLFDALSNALCLTIDPATAATYLHPSPSFVKEAQKTIASLSAIIHSLNTNADICKPLKTLHRLYSSRPEILCADEVHLLNLFLKDFEPYALDASAEKRQKLLQLHKEIDDASSVFVQASRTRSAHDAGAQAGLKTLRKLVTARSSLAQTLGFRSYARLVWGDRSSALDQRDGCTAPLNRPLSHRTMRLMKSPDDANQLLNELAEGCRNKAADEVRRRKERGSQDHKLDLKPNTITLKSAMDGFEDVMKASFGLSVRQVEMLSSENWAPGVVKYVVSEENKVRGTVYMDLGKRGRKYGGSAHFCIRGSCEGFSGQKGSKQIPCVVLSFKDFMQGSKGKRSSFDPRRRPVDVDRMEESCLTLEQASTLWHEWAHALHTILSKGRFQHLSGTRVEVDFVEVPSILFEYFARNTYGPKGTFDGTKPETVVPSSVDLRGDISVLKQDSNSTFEQPIRPWALNTLQQIAYAKIDLAVHQILPRATEKDIEDIVIAVYADVGVLSLPQKGAKYVASNFEHLVGYGAGYYGYLVAQVAAAQMWKDVFDKDPRNWKAGYRFKKEVLEVGAKKSPREILYSMLGSQLSTRAFIEEVNQR